LTSLNLFGHTENIRPAIFPQKVISLQCFEFYRSSLGLLFISCGSQCVSSYRLQ